MIPSPLEAVVFDMDGLLLDTEAVYRVAIREACAGLGYEMADPFYLSLIGTPDETSNAMLLAHFGASFPLRDFHLGCRERFDGLCREGVPLRPGAGELLRVLVRRGIPRGVATSTSRRTAEDHLARAGIRDHVDVLVTRSDVTQGKPHPESFLKVAAAFGAAPARCLALEDSYNGVRAAAAAGMATVMVPDMLPPTEEIRALCVGVVESLEVIARALDPTAAASALN
jgi:HAD superfamily hydrolase (TIGR01509 family)